MLDDDVRRLHDIYNSIRFDHMAPKDKQQQAWWEFVLAFAEVEFRDLLELINMFGTMLNPLAEKKINILHSKTLSSSMFRMTFIVLIIQLKIKIICSIPGHTGLVQKFTRGDVRYVGMEPFFDAQGKIAASTLFRHAGNLRYRYGKSKKVGQAPPMVRIFPELNAGPLNFLVWRDGEKNLESSFYPII